jgi:TetR/AcrR family transcriptional regulator, transcriptional repressor for nem operon
MRNPSPTREKIIDAGVRSLLAHGYDATGIGPLLASVAVPKGSFYHFFASKEDFAGAVLAAYSEKNREVRQAIFSDTTLSPMARLRAYFDQLEREVLSEPHSGGCLYGVLAHSVPALNPDLRDQLAAAFTRWEQELGILLAEAQRVGEIDAALDPSQAAAYLIDVYEGVVVRARAGNGREAFNRFRKFAMGALGRQTRPNRT